MSDERVGRGTKPKAVVKLVLILFAVLVASTLWSIGFDMVWPP